MFKVQTWNSPWKSIDWSQSIISTNQALQNSMEVRLSNRNWRLLFQHASFTILKRQTAARWSNTRGGRAKCIKLILCMWKTLRSQYYFSILKPTWKVKLAIPVLLEQEHLSVQNYRNFEWRINEKTGQRLRSSNFRQAFLASLPARSYGQDDVIHSRSKQFSYEILYMCCVYRGSFQDKASLYLSGRYQ